MLNYQTNRKIYAKSKLNFLDSKHLQSIPILKKIMSRFNQLFIIILVFLIPFKALSQSINMYFPKFAGKSYMFVLFQGSNTIKAEGIIPDSGKFTLTVPQNLAPYTGMARWLLTNSPDGGGLDVTLEGKDFSISCTVEKPTDADIVFTNNDETKELNRLYHREQNIFAKYNAMVMATKAYDENDSKQGFFSAEIEKHQSEYADFQTQLKNNPFYVAKFINIVNITQGMGTQLHIDDEKRLKNITNYITNDMDLDALFTSGHWQTVISSWTEIHLQMIKDASITRAEFITISSKLKTKDMYTQFCEVVTAEITKQGRDDLIEMLAPIIMSSGKILKYENSLSVYEKGRLGSIAPDLIISNKKEEVIKSHELAGNKYKNTLLIFYETGCSHCDDELKKLSHMYDKLSSQKIRVIAIAADTDEDTFKSNAISFPWKESYTDLKGFEGENFKNYGVRGTPTIFMLNSKGEITKREATIDAVIDQK